MANRKKSPAESFFLGLDHDGHWVLKAKDQAGNIRFATEAERLAEEQRFRDYLKAKAAEWRQAEAAVISDPDFRPDATDDRYRQYLAWVSGATPDYPPTMADLWIRRMEQARKHYQQTYPAVKPKAYLTSWREILVALEMKSNTEDRERVRHLNEYYNGPVSIPKQGAQPKVNKAKLIAWWNGLEAQWTMGYAKGRDATPTVATRYDYGRTGEAVPDIEGGVRKRRKNQKT